MMGEIERRELYDKYRKKFKCHITIVFQTSIQSLITSDRKLYDVEEATDEELDALMLESLEKGQNVLLEKFKDKEYTFVENPNCDY